MVGSEPVANGRKLEGSDPDAIWKQVQAGERVAVLAQIGASDIRFRLSTPESLSKQLKILQDRGSPIKGVYAVR